MKKDDEKVCLKRDEIQFSKSENKRPHGFLKKIKKIKLQKNLTWKPRFSSKHHSNKIKINK